MTVKAVAYNIIFVLIKAFSGSLCSVFESIAILEENSCIRKEMFHHREGKKKIIQNKGIALHSIKFNIKPLDLLNSSGLWCLLGVHPTYHCFPHCCNM